MLIYEQALLFLGFVMDEIDKLNNELYKLDKYAQYEDFRAKSPSWENLLTVNTCFIEHQKEAETLITQSLGYLPSVRVYADFIPFLNTIIHQRKTGQLLGEAYFDAYSSVIKQIRNHQMRIENRTREYEIGDYEDYFRLGKQYKHQARKILFDMLGFETKNIHSLDAELILRRKMLITDEAYSLSYTYSYYLAATIALYRYNYLEYGQAIADNTPLLGFEIPSIPTLANG